MDLKNPLRSVAPTVDADVLAVLARTHAPLTGVRVQRLAGRSYAQVREVLHRLVADGLVDSERHGNVVSYSLNRAHVLAAAVEAAASGDDEVERRLRDALDSWDPTPAAVVIFGSFARRDGDTGSDIDILLIRSDDVKEDDPAWVACRYELGRQVERWTGNAAQIVELASAELAAAAGRGDDLVQAVGRDGRVLMGPSLHTLLVDPPNATR
jgi:DNA-binding PadR family transcriptional regulator